MERGRMIGCRAIFIDSRAFLMVPYEGVVPPSIGLSQSSTRTAPALSAERQLSTLKQHTSSVRSIVIKLYGKLRTGDGSAYKSFYVLSYQSIFSNLPL